MARPLRTSERKMSNPQPGLLNHGNIYGTISLSSKSKYRIHSLTYYLFLRAFEEWGTLTRLFETVQVVSSLAC